MSSKSRVVRFPSFLQPEVFPYASVEVIRAEPVTTKLHLTARETTACTELLARGRTLGEALESIQLQRALLAFAGQPCGADAGPLRLVPGV